LRYGWPWAAPRLVWSPTLLMHQPLYIGGMTHAAKPAPATTPHTKTVTPMAAQICRLVSN
jgi:hypothetical protein